MFFGDRLLEKDTSLLFTRSCISLLSLLLPVPRFIKNRFYPSRKFDSFSQYRLTVWDILRSETECVANYAGEYSRPPRGLYSLWTSDLTNLHRAAPVFHPFEL